MNFKRFPRILTACLFLLIFYTSLLSQNIKSKTVIKAAVESGSADLDEQFGEGVLYRGILRVQSKITFPRSHFLIKGRFSREYYDIPESIKTINQHGNLTYVKYFVNSFLQINSSFNHHSSSLDSFGTQNISEWQLTGLYNRKISKSFNLNIRNTYLSRNFSLSDTDYSKNKLLLSLSFSQAANRVLGVGLFMENLYFKDTDKTDSKDLHGVQLDYQYNKLLILNLVYNYGFVLEENYNSHQLNFVAGKYLSNKLSVFVSLFYTWVKDDNNYLHLFNRVEIFNNINLKLGYDLFEGTNIYLKGILEDHKLVNYNNKISSRQLVLGIQQKF